MVNAEVEHHWLLGRTILSSSSVTHKHLSLFLNFRWIGVESACLLVLFTFVVEANKGKQIKLIDLYVLTWYPHLTAIYERAIKAGSRCKQLIYGSLFAALKASIQYNICTKSAVLWESSPKFQNKWRVSCSWTYLIFAVLKYEWKTATWLARYTFPHRPVHFLSFFTQI